MTWAMWVLITGRASQVGDRDYGELDNLAFSLEGRYSAEVFDIVYVGSYRDWELYTNEDQSLIAVNMVPVLFLW